jgi:hypothetical protein
MDQRSCCASATVTRTAGTTTVRLSATATSGLAVTFTIDLVTGRCSVEGTTVTVLAPEPCTVHADQGGSSSYLPAQRGTRALTVAAPVGTSPPSGPAPTQPAPDPTGRPELPVPPLERVQGRERTETAAQLAVDPTATALRPGQDEYLGQLRGGVKDLVAIGGPEALPPAVTSLVSARLDRPGVR